MYKFYFRNDVLSSLGLCLMAFHEFFEMNEAEFSNFQYDALRDDMVRAFLFVSRFMPETYSDYAIAELDGVLGYDADLFDNSSFSA